MLKIPVKINAVNNLSDARYGAGMGVEMMGFTVSESHPRFLPVEKINGIAGWISGINLIAESFGSADSALFEKAAAISAHAIEIDFEDYDPSFLKGSNIICRVELEEISRALETLPSKTVFHLRIKQETTDNLVEIARLCAERETILNVTALNLEEIQLFLKETKLYGISIDGGNELSPGLADLDHMANILEYLEEN